MARARPLSAGGLSTLGQLFLPLVAGDYHRSSGPNRLPRRHTTPERLPAADGRESGSRAFRHAHAKGRHQRGHPGLGHQRQRQLLHHRFCRRAGALSAHGSRFSGDHRSRSQGANVGDSRPIAVDRCCLRRWGIQRDGHLPRVRPREVRRAGRRRSRGQRTRQRRAFRLATPRRSGRPTSA